MSRAERNLQRWLTLSGAVYAAGAALFVARPDEAPDALARATGDDMEAEPTGVYHALAAAYMTTIAALALGAGSEPAARRALIPPLMVAKASSSAALFYRFLKTRRAGFAAGAALDAAILGVTAGLYANSRSR